MILKPKLIIVEEPRDDKHAQAWNALTQEQRKALTIKQLIVAMGPLHVNHPQFQQRPRSLLPLPNLTGVNGHVIEHSDRRWHVQIKMALVHFLAWVIR